MNSVKKIITTLALTVAVALSIAQIKNTTTESITIYGNCGMCKSTIEKAGNIKNTVKIEWNEDTKIATLTYDRNKTNPDEILKRIALVGYDNEKFLAPDDVYAQLPSCCQYERVAKVAIKKEEVKIEQTSAVAASQQEEKNQLQPIFDQYFLLQEALVKTDKKEASASAAELLKSISDVKMDTLEMEVHLVWMKVLNDLKVHSQSIAEAKAINNQRDHFIILSQKIYDLIKVTKQKTPTYLQHCPMANDGKGADWLSNENTIKNPYYGSQMMTCGKTVETIK